MKALTRSADFQSAVSPICNRQAAQIIKPFIEFGRRAEWNSAIQQIANLRCKAWAKGSSGLSILGLLVGLLFVSGCATTRSRQVSARPFEFQKDTFSFTNGLIWR